MRDGWEVVQVRSGYWHFVPTDWEGRPEEYAPGHLREEDAWEGLSEWIAELEWEAEDRRKRDASIS